MSNLKYVTATGETKEINIKPRFLTNKMRVEIAKLDNEAQMAFKAMRKEKENREYAKKNSEKIDEFQAKYELENPTHTEAEMVYAKALFLQDLLNNMTEDELKQMYEDQISTKAFEDEWIIRRCKLFIDYYDPQLVDSDKELLKSKHDSDFWQNADIEAVTDFVVSFRTKYKV
jgi:hypothetical protein